MRLPAGLLVALSLSVSGLNAATIKKLRLEELGHDPVNRITSPIYVTAGVAPVQVGTISSAYERKGKIVRGWGSLFTKGPSYDLDPGIDLGALLAEALRTEAKAMGFEVAAPGAAGSWEISGTLKDIHTETQQITGYGAMLSYGFLEVDLQVKDPKGAPATKRWRAHSFTGKVPGGWSRKDEGEAGIAHLLVEGAHDVLARFNREFAHAPAAPAMADRLKTVVASGVDDHEADVYVVGLSGLPAAGPALLAQLEKEKSENDRAHVINALGRLGSPDAIAVLERRYDTEDEDCRWYTVRAMDYLGTDKAIAVIRNKGGKDEDGATMRLVKKVLEAP